MPPGSVVDFFDASEMSGTPFKTLPARLKPLIKLGADYYCTEPNFVRDATYRSVQRAIINARPDYREEWNRRQKEMSESAFPEIMKNHLNGARVYQDVYYPLGNSQWAETDCIIIIDDVLILIEAKARAEALLPPAENLASHVRKVENLVLDSYSQCNRAINYLNSNESTPIYRKTSSGKYIELERVTLSRMRKVFPIGLTVEALTPFSSGVKERDDVTPICGRYNFFSISIDDLQVLKLILRGTGEFLHYLDVRHELAGMKKAMFHDEMDHLGAYIAKNRVDDLIREMMEKNKVDGVVMDGFDENILGPYFYHPDWPDVTPPKQEYPERLEELLAALGNTRRPNWLRGDSHLRDLGSDSRQNYANQFDRVFANLAIRQSTFFALGGERPALFWLERDQTQPNEDQLHFQAQAMALAFSVKELPVFRIKISTDKSISGAFLQILRGPVVFQANFPEISRRAVELRAKVVKL